MLPHITLVSFINVFTRARKAGSDPVSKLGGFGRFQ